MNTNNSKIKFKLVSFENKEQWKTWRDKGLTPEDTSALMGENPWESPEDLLIRKTQKNPEDGNKPVTQAMLKAKEHRPLALEAYRKEHPQYELSPLNIQNIANPWLIAHADLFDMKNAHIVEVRCGENAYEKALNKSFPPKPYWDEAQHILALTGLKFITLYFHNGNPDKLPFTIKVWRKDEYITRMIKESKDFMSKVSQVLNAHSDAAENKPNNLTEELVKAQRALEYEKLLARKVYEAVIGKAAKVDKDTYQKYVPSHFDKKGRLTPLGQSLLLQ
jgi:putative phage-type endonuclease